MGVDVRVDAQSDVSHFAFGHSELINHLHLGDALHVKALNFSIEGKVNLPIGLAYASIDDFLGVKAMLERGPHLIPTDTIDAEAIIAHLLKDSGVGIRFDCEVYAIIMVVSETPHLRQRLLEEGHVIIVERRLYVSEFVCGEAHNCL